MKKITLFLAAILVSATSIFAQTNQFVSVGTAYTTGTKSIYSAEIGCKTKNVSYSFVGEFRGSDTTGVYNVNGSNITVPKLVLGGKAQKQIRTLTENSTLNFFTAVKLGKYDVAGETKKETYVQVEPGLSLVFDLKNHLAIQTSLSTFANNDFSITGQTWPLKFGVSLSWIK